MPGRDQTKDIIKLDTATEEHTEGSEKDNVETETLYMK